MPLVLPSSRLRWSLSILLIFVILAAVAVYVAAVNVTMLDGETIKVIQGDIKNTAKKYTELREISLARQSPAWLEEQSRTSGMVEVDRMRFVSQDQSVALR